MFKTSNLSNMCLRPGCGGAMHCRGLCRSDYQIACQLVKQSKTTWGNLIKAGKVTPSHHRGPTNIVREWFLEEAKNVTA